MNNNTENPMHHLRNLITAVLLYPLTLSIWLLLEKLI